MFAAQSIGLHVCHNAFELFEVSIQRFVGFRWDGDGAVALGASPKAAGKHQGGGEGLIAGRAIELGAAGKGHAASPFCHKHCVVFFYNQCVL